MSARSRALRELAAHLRYLQAEAQADAPCGMRPIYTAADAWDHAADMAERTADEERWRERIPRLPRKCRYRARVVWLYLRGCRPPVHSPRCRCPARRRPAAADTAPPE